MSNKRVLFVCIHNSARSQMAMTYLNKYGSDLGFVAESAGIEPGVLNPLAVEAMRLDGIDIANNPTNSVFDFYKEGRLYRYVVTVCDPEAAEKCPIFPGVAKRLHWGFKDPSSFTGTPEERVSKTIEVREEIKQAVRNFIEQFQDR
jgi:arsenate reductase (thioredoxin)